MGQRGENGKATKPPPLINSLFDLLLPDNLCCVGGRTKPTGKSFTQLGKLAKFVVSSVTQTGPGHLFLLRAPSSLVYNFAPTAICLRRRGAQQGSGEAPNKDQVRGCAPQCPPLLSDDIKTYRLEPAFLSTANVCRKKCFILNDIIYKDF